MNEDKKYPEPTIGVVIYNDKNEIFLTQCDKWGDLWNLPGGHIELGEKYEDTVIRETKEETGLDLSDIEFIGLQNAIYPKEFSRKAHFVFLDFKARVSGGEIKKSDEMIEHQWIRPEEALKKLKLNPYTKISIKQFIKTQEGDFKHKYLHALADYQNLLKQTAREKEEFVKFANEQMILDFLPVYDNLKVSLEHVGEEAKGNGWIEGIKHVIKQFADILNNFGVEEIKTVGEKFDPNTMEAMEQEKTDEKDKDGIVAKEIMAGYKLKDKVIRAARVIVFENK